MSYQGGRGRPGTKGKKGWTKPRKKKPGIADIKAKGRPKSHLILIAKKAEMTTGRGMELDLKI